MCYLGDDVVQNFITSMIEESKFCTDIMKKHFHKELVLTKEDDEDFENSTKYWICNNTYVDCDARLRDHCHITGKHRDSAHRDCITKIKLNHKIPIVLIMIHILLCKK